MSWNRWCNEVQKRTEAFLTWRKKRLHRKQVKKKARGRLVDGLLTFVWAVCVVLLINQYFFEAYQIPSGSMEEAILIGDRIFVNLLIYGPALFPKGPRIPSPVSPMRGEVVIFESPEYLSKGPFFDVLHRIIFKATLSLVDIDRGHKKRPRVRFLVKRFIGVGGDRIRFREGDLWIRPEGESKFLTEREFKNLEGHHYRAERRISKDNYSFIKDYGHFLAFQEAGLAPPKKLEKTLQDSLIPLSQIDKMELVYQRNRTLQELRPHDPLPARGVLRYKEGQYIPHGWALMLGDNRDNSHDGRFFGLVRQREILGRAALRFFPLHRIGFVR